MSKEKTGKFPWFWLLYALYTVLLIVSVVLLLRLLWKFLEVYEETRPVHAMEAELSILAPEQRETLVPYLTNTVDNPYEDLSVLLTRFYERTSGQELTFGKLSGSYSESHPVYAVLAGDEQVATLSFVMQETETGYGLYGWSLEAVTLLDTPKYSFAVTIPSSMQLFINRIPVDGRSFVGETETDTPVSYFNYADSGLYEEPLIEVFDRYGSAVELKRDEETGGCYYRLAYVCAPSDVTVSFGGHTLPPENLLAGGIPIEELSFLSSLENRFFEYSGLRDRTGVPSFESYYIDFAYTPDDVSFTDRFGAKVLPAYDPETNTYSCGLVSNDSLLEECSGFACSFVESYALFCMRDAEQSVLTPYFPKNSEYCALISKMDNRWANKHSDVSFPSHEITEFFAYSDSLVFIHVTMQERLKLYATGKYVTYNIDSPLWLAKLDGQWYVALISFDGGEEE